MRRKSNQQKAISRAISKAAKSRFGRAEEKEKFQGPKVGVNKVMKADAKHGGL